MGSFFSLALNTSTLPPGGGEKRYFYKQIRRAWQPPVLGVTELDMIGHTHKKNRCRRYFLFNWVIKVPNQKWILRTKKGIISDQIYICFLLWSRNHVNIAVSWIWEPLDLRTFIKYEQRVFLWQMTEWEDSQIGWMKETRIISF